MARSRFVVPLTLILVVAMIGAGVFFSTQQELQPGASCRGQLSVLSASQVDVEIEGEGAQRNIRLLVSPTGNGECAVLSFRNTVSKVKQELQQEQLALTPEGEQRLRDLVVEARVVKQTVNYDVFPDEDSKIVQVQQVRVPTGTFSRYRFNILELIGQSSSLRNACARLLREGELNIEDGVIVAGAVERVSGPNNFYCYVETERGQTASFATVGKVDTSTEFYVNGRLVDTIDERNLPITREQANTRTKDNRRYVADAPGILSIEYVGSLVSGAGLLPSTPEAGFDVIALDNTYVLVIDGAKQRLETEYERLHDRLNALTGSIRSTEVVPIIDDYRGIVARHTTSQLHELVRRGSPYVLSAGTKFQSSSGRTSLVVDFSDSPVIMPLFTIDTDADYIKIVRVAGEPEIVGCERGGFTLTSQSFRDVSFRVRNKGSSSGSFTGNLRCNDAAQALAPQTITTQPGQTVTYRARNGFASTTDQEIDCTFTVTDRVSGRQATCGYQWQVEARRCSDGVTSCSVENPNQLMICRNGFPELLETCERGCVGNACRDENDPLRETDCDDGYDNDGDGLVDQLDPDCEGASNIPENERLCQEAITVGGTLLVPDIGQDADGDPCTGTFATVRWALAVIVFIAAWFAITYGLNRLLRRGRRTQPGLVTLNVVIGLVVAALLYILVMKLFVIGIIVGVVASILATVLPRFRRF